MPRLKEHGFDVFALNPLDEIYMPNKQSSKERFRTDTAIK